MGIYGEGYGCMVLLPHPCLTAYAVLPGALGAKPWPGDEGGLVPSGQVGLV